MLLLAFLLAAAPDPAALAKIGITGRTRAPDSAAAQSALSEAGRFARGTALKCSEMGPVEASLMPKGWVPADPNFRIGPKGARYERWDIKLCGKEVPFLVVFFKVKGKADFQVAHPFPAGSVKR